MNVCLVKVNSEYGVMGNQLYTVLKTKVFLLCYLSVGAEGEKKELRGTYFPVSGFVAIRVKSVESLSLWQAFVCCSNTHSVP